MSALPAAMNCEALAAQCLPVPEGLSLHAAADAPPAAFTVWHDPFEPGRLPRPFE